MAQGCKNLRDRALKSGVISLGKQGDDGPAKRTAKSLEPDVSGKSLKVAGNISMSPHFWTAISTAWTIPVERLPGFR